MITQKSKRITKEERKVVVASSVGSVFEWYDFFLYGYLAAAIAKQFFTRLDPSTGLIFALLAFAVGFIARPFGALVFGRIGDTIGRKFTFIVTITTMGLSTFIVGLLPNYDSIGIAAPIILISLRILQGLALGGEYGGAAIYVAEHAPVDRRGAFTSWIQTTGTAGILLAVAMIFGTRALTGEAAFGDWGWRVPFLMSAPLLAISVWIRLSMNESPVFAKMKAEGKASTTPLLDSFAHWGNLKVVLLAIFGVTGGLGVVWYTGQFYVLLFLTKTLKVDGSTSLLLVAAALLIGTPLFVVFGTLSDRIGRKKLVLGGMLIAALTTFPVFQGLTHYANPALEKALANAPVVVVADPAECQFQFNPTGTKKFESSCDILKTKLTAASVSYSNQAAPPGTVASVKIGDDVLMSFDARKLSELEAGEKDKALSKQLATAIQKAGYPTRADPAQINKPMTLLLLLVLMLGVTMSYGPIPAMLVEMFPTRIRYSSVSLSYHLGTGWFGGLLPASAFAIVAYQGDIYSGLWYPVLITLVTVAIGTIFLREKKDIDLGTNMEPIQDTENASAGLETLGVKS